MPSLRSGEMFGAKNLPNGDFRPSPPPSLALSSWSGVAWQAAQPPAQKMVLPFSRSGVRGSSALAGTVAGIVSIQKAAAPMTTTAMTASPNRRMQRGSRNAPATFGRALYPAWQRNAIALGARWRRRSQAAESTEALFRLPRRRGRLAIGLMAIAAGLAHLRERDLELVERLRLVFIVAHCLSEGSGLGVEVALGLPNLRQCPGLFSGFRRLGEQGRQLLRGLGPMREGRIDLCDVERLFAPNHLVDGLQMLKIPLHQRLALRERIGLGNRDGHSDRNGCHD